MKKCAILILITLLVTYIPIFADISESECIWIEAENYTTKEGDYIEYQSEPASNGKMLILESTDDSVKHTINYEFEVSKADEYDLWMLSTHGTAIYVSVMKWKVDNGAYKGVLNPLIDAVEATADVRKVPMYWIKLGSAKLDSGKHTLSINAPQKRTMGNDYYYHAIDSISILPSKWDYDMFGISKPFAPSDIKVELAGGEIIEGTPQAKSTIKLRVKNKLLERTKYTPRLYAAVIYNGETVAKDIKQPRVPMANWMVGQSYAEEFKLDIPFNVPKGKYEIITGVAGGQYVNGEQSAVVADFIIGEEKIVKPKLVLNVENLELPGEQTKGSSYSLKASVNVSRDVDFDTTGYLAFYKDNLLWGIIELDDIKTSEFVEGKSTEVSFDYNVNQDMPAGKYQVKLGFHQFETLQETLAEVVINGEPLNNKRTHKPLGNGLYYEKYEGRSHLWYINQAHTMIWDGEPYIPVGGMFSSDYIVQYDPNDMEKAEEHWNADVKGFEQMLSYGIHDVYINPARTALTIPNYAWQFLIDWLEEHGVIYGLQLNSVWVGLDQGITDHLATTAFFMRGNEEGTIYKTDNVTKSGIVSYNIPNYAQNVMSFGIEKIENAFMLINNATMKPVQVGYGTGQIEADGSMTLFADVELPEDGNYFVVFSPKLRIGGSLSPNMWDTPGYLEGEIQKFLSKMVPGKNFRFFVDPIMNEEGYGNWFESARYTAPTYHAMYEEWLKAKYPTLEELNEAWQITPAVKSYYDAACIIPMYTGKKGTDMENVTYALDCEKMEHYQINIRVSVMWEDYLAFKDNVFCEYNSKIADAIKEVINAPVIYKQTGYLNEFLINKNTSGGFDGVGNESYGDNLNYMTAISGFTYSETEQANRTMWAVITETNTDEDMGRKYRSDRWGYDSEEHMHDHFQGLYNSGVKGSFDFLFYGYHNIVLDGYTYPSKPEMYAWLKNFRDKLLAEETLDTIVNGNIAPDPYFVYPASTTWWWYPNKRGCVMYDDDKLGYRSILLDGNRFAWHTNNPYVDTEMLMVFLENTPATKVWGPEFLKMLRGGYEGKKIVFGGLRRDLGELPEIDKYYTDEIITLQNGDLVQILKPTETSKVLYTTNDGRPWALRDGDLYIVANKGAFNKLNSSDGQYTNFNIINDLDGGSYDVSVAESDIDGHWAEASIRTLINDGIMQGMADGTFKPDNNITRAEFLALIIRMIKLETASYDGCFDDVKNNDWYADVIQTAYNIGLIDANMVKNGQFSPNKNITREEIASVAVKLYCSVKSESLEGRSAPSFADGDNISKWALAYVKAAADKGLMLGMPNGCFEPLSSSTRAEAAVLLQRLRDQLH